MTDKHILVTGVPRCGSTFTGKIISLDPHLSYIQEPFNPDYGLVGADDHFPGVDVENPDDKYSALLNDFFSFKAQYKKNFSQDNIIKKLAKFIFGPRAQINYRISKLLHGKDVKLLIKDPDAALLSEQMYLKHSCNVLILVRHPAAVYASTRRIGGTPYVADYIEKEFFYRHQMPKHADLFKNDNKSLAEEVGLLWVYIYKTLNAYYKKYNDWLLVLHEDISQNPLESFQTIFDWAGIELTDNIKMEISTLTDTNNPVLARQNKMHDLNRNSASLTDYWKESVSDEDIGLLREITEPVSSQFYDESSWKR